MGMDTRVRSAGGSRTAYISPFRKMKTKVATPTVRSPGASAEPSISVVSQYQSAALHAPVRTPR
jgi:hypothetical protein